MVLPSHEFDDVVASLNRRGVNAVEMGLQVIVHNPEAWGLCDLSEEDVAVLSEARALADSMTLNEPPSRRCRELMPLCEAIEGRWCAELGGHGITAEPYKGLGVVFGHELLYGSIVLPDPKQLRELLSERFGDPGPGVASDLHGRSTKHFDG